MTSLETYLKRATKGVWGRKRLEVIAELRGSIEARAWKLECQGYSPELALETALRELGEPKAIAAGLRKVHTMPTIFRNALALGMFAAFSLTVLNSSHAQIEVAALTDNVVYVGEGALTTSKYTLYLLNFQSIKANLEKLGIAVDDTPLGALESTLNPKKTVPTLRFTFPGSARETILQATPVAWRTPSGGLEWASFAPANLEPDQQYIAFSTFTEQLKKRSGLPITLNGWRNPTLEIGSTTLQIGSDRLPATPWNLYLGLAERAVAERVQESNRSFGQAGGGAWHHAVRVHAPAGSVYAMTEPYQYSKNLYWEIARVADDGVLYFKASHQILEFTQSLQALASDVSNPRPSGYGSSQHPAKALLIRIKPDLTTAFERPARVRSGASK